MNPFSLHLPNDKPLEQHHWGIITRVQPGLVVVCEPYFSDVPRLREVVPGVVVVGRMYGDQSLGISNWSRPDDRALANMAEFGRRSGHKANQYDIDIMTPFNEPSIDMSIPTTPDGFSLIAQMFIDWLIGYRQTTTRKAGTIALAPGGREDDDGGWGYRGADILRPAFDLADVLLLHNYWNRGTDTYGVPLVQSEWEGDRARRQLAAYDWTKEWAITECNRPLKEDSEKAEIATQARVFIDQHAAKPGFLGACWFILDTADDQFREHRMVNNDFLINEAVAINTDYAARGHQPPGEPNTVPGGPETPPESPLSIPTALIAAALLLAPGPQRPASKPLVWTWHERNITETATLRPHLSADDVVTIALGLGATIYQESDGEFDARGDLRNGYYCSRGLFQLNTCGGVGSTIMAKYRILADDLDNPKWQYLHAQTLILALEAELYWSRQENRPFNAGKAIQSVQRSSSDPTGAGYQAAYETLRRELTPIEGNDMAMARIGNLDVIDVRGRYPSTYTHRDLSQITNISIHHSATPTLPDDASDADELAALDAIHTYHSDTYKGIAYPMVVFPSGRCYLTGDWDTIRYVVGGAGNITTLSILLHGTFTDTVPGPKQIEGARTLIPNVRYQLGNGNLPVVGHKEIASAPTACPGDTWDIWKPWLTEDAASPMPVDTRTPLHIQLDSLFGLISQVTDDALRQQMFDALYAAKDAAGIT